MSFFTISVDTVLTPAEQASYLVFDDRYKGAKSISDYFLAMGGGLRDGLVTVNVGALQASGTLTITSTGPALDETVTVAGVVLTAVASAPTAVQFIRNNTPATAAANIATAVNLNPTLAGVVTATSVGGVVTCRAVVPGKSGNALILSDAAANTESVTFAAGSNGTSVTLNFA